MCASCTEQHGLKVAVEHDLEDKVVLTGTDGPAMLPRTFKVESFKCTYAWPWPTLAHCCLGFCDQNGMRDLT